MFRPEQLDGMIRSTPAATLASFPVFSLPGATSCDSAWAQMRAEALDFDVVLVDPFIGEPRIVRRDPSWATKNHLIAEVAEPPDPELVVGADEPLSTVLERLVRSDYVLLRYQGRIHGIITLSDVRKPEATLWTFGVVLSLENALTMLIPSLTDRRWMDRLTKRRRRELDTEIKKRKREGAHVSDEDCLSLLDKLKLLHGILGKEVAESGRKMENVLQPAQSSEK